MMTENRDTAGVIAPPPLIALAAVLIGVALDWLLPAYVLTVLFESTHRPRCIAHGGWRRARPLW
jgi:hypothetical protein